MEVETFVVPPLSNNVYLVYDAEGKDALLVDSALGASKVLPRVQQLGLSLKHVWNTHGHADHVADNGAVAEATGAKVAIHEADAFRLERLPMEVHPWLSKPPPARKADVVLKEGTTLEVGSTTLRVLHTPGHTQGSCAFYAADDGVLFSGDTLLAGTFGSANGPGGSPAFLWQSLRRLFNELPPPTKVFPGHGRTTVIGDEAWIANLRYAAPH